MSKNLRLSIFILLFLFLALCSATTYADFAYAADGNFIELIFVWKDNVSEPVLVEEGTAFPGIRDIEEELPEGYTMVWRLENDTKVEFPYTVTAADATDGKIYFYGFTVRIEEPEQKIDITVSAGADETVLSFACGAVPDLPDKIFGFSVSGWYLNADYSELYVPHKIETPITLYPLFTDRKITVTVDGEDTEVDFGSKLSPKADTATHRFTGYTQNELPFDERILSPVTLTSVYERVNFRITVIKDGATELYFAVGEAVDKEALTTYGNKFTFDSARKNEIEFPFTPENDVSIYAFDKTPDVTPEAPTPQAYAIAVNCLYANITVQSQSEAGKPVSFTINSIDADYKIISVTVASDDTPVAVLFDGKTGRFIMPDGNVTITVSFENANADTTTTTPATKKKITLTTKEIIAISVTGSALLIAGVTFLIIKIKKKKEKDKKKHKTLSEL